MICVNVNLILVIIYFEVVSLLLVVGEDGFEIVVRYVFVFKGSFFGSFLYLFFNSFCVLMFMLLISFVICLLCLLMVIFFFGMVRLLGLGY